jgi:PDZ domain-containing protein
LTDAKGQQPQPRSRAAWLTPGRIAATGGLLLVIAAIILWIVPAHGYQLEIVDTAHPVAPLVHVKLKRSAGPGTIYFVDVRERPAQLIERLLPWARPDGSSLAHTPSFGSAADRRLSQLEMIDSQKIAPYVALKLAGYHVSLRGQGVTVEQVAKDAPASKLLQIGDVIVAVDGHPVKAITDLRALLSRKRPGAKLEISFRRGTALHEGTVTTVASATDPKQALIGIIISDNVQVELPVDVTFDASGIGGPSAGLAFALEILRELGRNVTHGHKIAATGELALDGSVLPIGGVKQKTLGARRAHVDVFLVPAGDNAREARRYADGLRIIPVENVQQALRALATLGPKA